MQLFTVDLVWLCVLALIFLIDFGVLVCTFIVKAHFPSWPPQSLCCIPSSLSSSFYVPPSGSSIRIKYYVGALGTIQYWVLHVYPGNANPGTTSLERLAQVLLFHLTAGRYVCAHVHVCKQREHSFPARCQAERLSLACHHAWCLRHSFYYTKAWFLVTSAASSPRALWAHWSLMHVFHVFYRDMDYIFLLWLRFSLSHLMLIYYVIYLEQGKPQSIILWHHLDQKPPRSSAHACGPTGCVVSWAFLPLTPLLAPSHRTSCSGGR